MSGSADIGRVLGVGAPRMTRMHDRALTALPGSRSQSISATRRRPPGQTSVMRSSVVNKVKRS
jgi:hypothetical protein